MKICITGDSAKSCDRAMDDCVGCVPGGGVHVVEQLTLSEMVDVASSCIGQVNELEAIIGCMMSLNLRLRLGDTNKTIFRDQLRRLCMLESNLICSGRNLLLNLMFQRDQEIVHDESESQAGPDTQEESVTI